MKRLLMNDEDYMLVKRMKDVQGSMCDIIKDLSGVLPRTLRDEVVERIASAAEKFTEAMCIFAEESMMDYDEWVKDNNAQTKKKET